MGADFTALVCVIVHYFKGEIGWCGGDYSGRLDSIYCKCNLKLAKLQGIYHFFCQYRQILIWWLYTVLTAINNTLHWQFELKKTPEHLGSAKKSRPL
jgi:hypothetical protein